MSRRPALFLASAAFLALVSCKETSTEERCVEDAVTDASWEISAPTLHLCALRPEYVRGEAIQVLVVLRGSRDPLSLMNHPDLYRFDVVDSNGDTLRPHVQFHAVMHYGERARLTLPAHGLLAFVVDLSCLRSNLAPRDTLFPDCWSRYQLDQGTYQVTARREVPLAADTLTTAHGVAMSSGQPILVRVR